MAADVPSATPAVTSGRKAVTSGSWDHRSLWVSAFRLWTPKQRGKVQGRTYCTEEAASMSWAFESTAHFILVHSGENTHCQTEAKSFQGTFVTTWLFVCKPWSRRKILQSGYCLIFIAASLAGSGVSLTLCYLLKTLSWEGNFAKPLATGVA